VLPTFLVIGAMKAGTTSLWGYLSEHPQVFMAPDKELNFFSGQWSRGLDWYESQFAGAADATAVGEISPSYAMVHFFPVPERIASVIPDARLIYLLRHPIERMVSAYLHWVAEGREQRPIEQAFLEDLNYLHMSRYAFQLERFLERFPRDRVLLVLSERLRDSRPATLRDIYSFIGVDRDWVGPSSAEERHRTADKRVRTERAERRRGTALYRVAARMAPSPLKRWHYRATTRPVVEQAALSPELEARIRDALAPDVARLRDFLDPAFDGWGIG
jgi:hypothetical protein